MTVEQCVDELAQELKDRICMFVKKSDLPHNVHPMRPGQKLPIGLRLNRETREWVAKLYYGDQTDFHFDYMSHSDQNYQGAAHVRDWLASLSTEHRRMIANIHLYLPRGVQKGGNQTDTVHLGRVLDVVHKFKVELDRTMTHAYCQLYQDSENHMRWYMQARPWFDRAQRLAAAAKSKKQDQVLSAEEFEKQAQILAAAKEKKRARVLAEKETGKQGLISAEEYFSKKGRNLWV